MKWTLARFLECAHGTFGLLLHEGATEDQYLFTCEDDWQQNRPNVSSIPVGKYKMQRTLSPKFGECFTVTGVPGRSYIRIHAGNTEEDTEGCILLGLTLGVMLVPRDEDTGRQAKKLAVLQSRLAIARFMLAMTGVNEADLEVKGFGG